jgi:hypothetical protein
MQFVCPQTATAICIPATTIEIIPSQLQNTVVEHITFESPSHVQSIPFHVFLGCISLKSGCIPTSITKIGDQAFCQCQALSIVIFESPSIVTEFGFGAFAVCISLESINIPPSLLRIGNSCFHGDLRLSEVIFECPSQLTSNGHGVFQNCCVLYSFYIPARLQTFRGMPFFNSAIMDVEVDPENKSFSMVSCDFGHNSKARFTCFFSQNFSYYRNVRIACNCCQLFTWRVSRLLVTAVNLHSRVCSIHRPWLLSFLPEPCLSGF